MLKITELQDTLIKEESTTRSDSQAYGRIPTPSSYKRDSHL